MSKKPIEKAYITAVGDSSVGIPDQNFELSLYFDLEWLAEKYRDGAVEGIRQKIVELYETIGEDNVKVRFDFEVETENNKIGMLTKEEQ